MLEEPKEAGARGQGDQVRKDLAGFEQSSDMTCYIKRDPFVCKHEGGGQGAVSQAAWPSRGDERGLTPESF